VLLSIAVPDFPSDPTIIQEGISMNYTYLRRGDELPAVGVLQKLLNRSGARIIPDGIFGPKTLAAVQNFQRLRGLGQDGLVGEITWAKVSAGVSLPIVDSIDVWDKTFFLQDATYIRKAGGRPLLIGGMCNGVEQAISMIRANSRSVFLLRFHGHGGPGLASVASGHGELDPKLREGSDISSNPQIMATLHTLRSVFGPYGCVQFIECETGRGKQGRRLLSRMADELGVPVTAAVNDQPFSRLATFRLEGPTVTCFPGGRSLNQWCRALPDFAGYSAA
jgi:peptidoglycan hydrolase-like protein with peptidoglycan-binding domain